MRRDRAPVDAQAAAYALVPGNPGVVNALAYAFTALELLVPFALGSIAADHGPAAALAALAVQPLCMLVVALEGHLATRNRPTSGYSAST